MKTSNSLHDDNFEQIRKTGTIGCVDYTQNGKFSLFTPKLITRDIEEGMKDAEAVLVLTQSLQHRDLAPRIAPFLKEGQTVLIIPGNMGSLQFSKYTTDRDIVYAEAESTPYDARIAEPGTVHILFMNVRNAVSFLKKDHEKHLDRIDALFGRHKFMRTNIVESALHNPNLVIHTVGAIMSASRIEYSKGEFWMYREAFSPAVWNVIEQLDKEKMTIMEYCGCRQAVRYLDACKWRNEEDLSQDSMKVFQMYADTGGPKGPTSLDSRYICEDVPMGLCLLENLGACAGISTPVASSLITLASCLLKRDFRKIAYQAEEIKPFINILRNREYR